MQVLFFAISAFFSTIFTALRYLLSPWVHVGFGTRVSLQAKLSTMLGGRIRVGKHCRISPYALLMTYGGNIQIGDYCSINPFCVLYGHGGLKIGNHVRIAAHTVIIPANHVFDSTETPIRKQGLRTAGVEIADDVWIGTGARILDGVKIAKGCIIAAGAVVTKSTEPNGIYGGCPAKLIKMRTD